MTAIADVPGDDAGGIEGPTESREQAERHWQQLLDDANAAIDAAIEALGTTEAERRVDLGDPGPMSAPSPQTSERTSSWSARTDAAC
jgi:hypothetical protein